MHLRWFASPFRLNLAIQALVCPLFVGIILIPQRAETLHTIKGVE